MRLPHRTRNPTGVGAFARDKFWQSNWKEVPVKLFVLLLLALPAFASDHIDGPITTGHRVADLTDLYAFRTPGRAGSLSVILNAYPLVHPAGHFTDKVNYTLYFRKASLKGTGDRASIATSNEVSLNCTFVTPADDKEHRVTCKGSNGIMAENQYEKVTKVNAGDDFRLFAGKRSDPFFFDADFAKNLANEGKIVDGGSDVMANVNILTIVLEIDVNKLFPGGASLIALAAETTTQDSPGGRVRRLDRVGRPEVTNVSMVAHGKEPDLRDQYNTDRPFQVSPANTQLYLKRLAENISFYDKVDGKSNWKDADRLALADIVADDFLLVDVSKPCRGGGFFEIEKALLQHKAHETCGGRQLNDDIMDILYTLYVGSFDGARVSDGVFQPTKSVSDSFPYLAEPELGLFARAKAFFARKLLGVENTR